MNNVRVCTPQPSYVVVEQIHPKPGLPAIGNTIGPSMYQVFRRVLQVCAEQDVVFEGRRIAGSPSIWQYLHEVLRPGPQITTTANGKQHFVLSYAGFRNLLTPLPEVGGLLPEAWTKQYDLGTPSTPFKFGKDPIPLVRLHGDPRVRFVMPGGRPPATAVGIWHSDSKRLDVPDYAERQSVIEKLVQPLPARAR